jgi:hypothetical protein
MTDVRERLLVEKIKVSLKSKLLDYGTYYLVQFKQGWDHIPNTVIGEAIRQLEAEKFLTVRTGRKGAVILVATEMSCPN